MNYSPANQQGLLGLVQALKAGLDPNTALGIYQGIQQDQAQRIANRQARLSSLTDLLSQNASQGMTYGQAQTLAEVQPGPVGPAVENILNTLYPGAEGAPQRVAPWLANGPGVSPELMAQQQARTQPQIQSPLYSPNPVEQLQQQAAAIEAQQTISQAGMQQAWSDLVADAQKYRAAGKTMDDFIQLAAQAYPELVGTDPEQFQKVVATVFHQSGA